MIILNKIPYLKILTFFSLLQLSGCADLVVNNVDVTWDSSNKVAHAQITNIGNGNAGEFMVYFNADENPVSQNHRPQISHRINGLEAGASINLEANFIPLAHHDNHNLDNVYQITVMADPKQMVRESDESNNIAVMAIPSGSVVDAHNLISAGNIIVNNSQSAGQTFTITQSGQLLAIEVSAERCNATTADQLTLEFGQGTTALGSHAISGAILPAAGGCGVTPASLNNTTTGPGYFDLSGLNLLLTAGQVYYFKLTGPTSPEFIIGISGNVYSGGTITVNGMPSIHDLVFKIIIQPL